MRASGPQPSRPVTLPPPPRPTGTPPPSRFSPADQRALRKAVLALLVGAALVAAGLIALQAAGGPAAPDLGAWLTAANLTMLTAIQARGGLLRGRTTH